MITELRIKSFGCFKSPLTVKFGKLTLLTGDNGTGKTTVLSALMQLRKSVQGGVGDGQLEVTHQITYPCYPKDRHILFDAPVTYLSADRTPPSEDLFAKKHNMLWLGNVYGFLLPSEVEELSLGQKHALMMVDAIYASQPYTLKLIENPELFLDQQAQSTIGSMLASGATDNQIIIETHSDHILNGIRLAVKDGNIKPEDISIQFFTRDSDGENHAVTTLAISKDGGITNRPEGFFDQIERDLLELF